MNRSKLKKTFGGREMEEVTVSASPPWKKNSLWLSRAAAISGDLWAWKERYLVGEKESVIDVRAKGMRIAFAAMRVKASEGELQRAMQVGAVLEGLRKSIKLRAREMRSIARGLGSRKWVA